MPSTSLLLKSISRDYPHIHFESGDDFHWSFDNSTITYQNTDPHASAHIIHELAHALLNHHSYAKDIELIGIERDAWVYASTTLSSKYNIEIHDNVVQSALDSYRDWLHARSTCPRCKATGIETLKSEYHCIACEHNWRVNEARICSLRRYSI